MSDSDGADELPLTPNTWLYFLVPRSLGLSAVPGGRNAQSHLTFALTFLGLATAGRLAANGFSGLLGGGGDG